MINKRIFLFAWTLFVLLLIIWPMAEGAEVDSGNLDKAIHFFLFGVFAYLLAINIENKLSAVKITLIAFIAGCLYSYLAEVIQLYIPGRYYSRFDLAAGIIGVCVFLAIFYVRQRK